MYDASRGNDIGGMGAKRLVMRKQKRRLKGSCLFLDEHVIFTGGKDIVDCCNYWISLTKRNLQKGYRKICRVRGEAARYHVNERVI